MKRRLSGVQARRRRRRVTYFRAGCGALVAGTADMTSVVIRDARHDDAGELARLCTLLAYPVDGDRMAVRLAHLLASPAHPVRVAASSDDDGDLLGMVAAEWRLMIEFGLERIAVDDEDIRLGAGRDDPEATRLRRMISAAVLVAETRISCGVSTSARNENSEHWRC